MAVTTDHESRIDDHIRGAELEEHERTYRGFVLGVALFALLTLTVLAVLAYVFV